MNTALKPRQDLAEELGDWLDKKKQHEKEMWEAIQDGTFVSKYAKDVNKIFGDSRLSLQKAIDENTQNIPISRKTTPEEGDIQMFDGQGWDYFCIHKARNLVINHKIALALRTYKNGQWINDEKLTDTFRRAYVDNKYLPNQKEG